jgi:hypothetical protein
MRNSTPKQALAKTETDHGRTSIGKKKTDNGKLEFYSKGGSMKESKAMEMKHVAAMKKAGVPKKFVKEEMSEAMAMKKGGVAKYAKGGGIESKGKTKGKMVAMRGGGKC